MEITEWRNGVVTVREMTEQEKELLSVMEVETENPELTAEEALEIIVNGGADNA